MDVYTIWKRIYDERAMAFKKESFVGNFYDSSRTFFAAERNSLDELAEAFSLNGHIPQEQDKIETIACISRLVGLCTDYPVSPTQVISFEERFKDKITSE